MALTLNQEEKETATLTWTIDEFSDLDNEDELVTSPYFCVPNSKDQFRLTIKPNHQCFGQNHVYVSLQYSANKNELFMKFGLSILDENDEEQYDQKYKWNYCRSAYNWNNFDVPNYISRDKCNEMLVNGSLKIYCEVDVLKNKEPELSSSPVNEKVETAPEILTDYLTILENGEFSDFVFVVSGREFKVHKNVLAARSKVFQTMFNTNLVEKRQNRAQVTDIEVEVFEVLLRYIYGGSVMDLEKYDLELFMAADKYQLDHLKFICEQSLCSSLTIESVAAVLQHADLYQSAQLRSKCIKFIKTNSTAVIATDGWKQLRKYRFELAEELLDSINHNLKIKKK